MLLPLLTFAGRRALPAGRRPGPRQDHPRRLHRRAGRLDPGRRPPPRPAGPAAAHASATWSACPLPRDLVEAESLAERPDRLAQLADAAGQDRRRVQPHPDQDPVGAADDGRRALRRELRPDAAHRPRSGGVESWYFTANDDAGGGTFPVIQALRDRMDVTVSALGFNHRFLDELVARVEAGERPEDHLPAELVFTARRAGRDGRRRPRGARSPRPSAGSSSSSPPTSSSSSTAAASFEYRTKDTVTTAGGRCEVIERNDGADLEVDLGAQTAEQASRSGRCRPSSPTRRRWPGSAATPRSGSTMSPPCCRSCCAASCCPNPLHPRFESDADAELALDPISWLARPVRPPRVASSRPSGSRQTTRSATCSPNSPRASTASAGRSVAPPHRGSSADRSRSRRREALRPALRRPARPASTSTSATPAICAGWSRAAMIRRPGHAVNAGLQPQTTLVPAAARLRCRAVGRAMWQSWGGDSSLTGTSVVTALAADDAAGGTDGPLPPRSHARGPRRLALAACSICGRTPSPGSAGARLRSVRGGHSRVPWACAPAELDASRPPRHETRSAGRPGRRGRRDRPRRRIPRAGRAGRRRPRGAAGIDEGRFVVALRRRRALAARRRRLRRTRSRLPPIGARGAADRSATLLGRPGRIRRLAHPTRGLRTSYLAWLVLGKAR